MASTTTIKKPAFIVRDLAHKAANYIKRIRAKISERLAHIGVRKTAHASANTQGEACATGAACAALTAPASAAASAGQADTAAGSTTGGKTSLLDQARALLDKLKLTPEDQASFYEPFTWPFWRSAIICFFVFSVVGHWMEIPYCNIMHALFGIVEDDYAVWFDPFYVPYWVYGIGATVITIFLVPLKARLIRKSKTLWGAALKFVLIAVGLCAFMECGIGLIINQPDAFGEYPYWNNARLPLNILDQAWLVNDILLGLISLLYVWFIYPVIRKVLKVMGERNSDKLFSFTLVGAAAICCMSYVPMLL